MNKKSLLSILLALILCFTTVVPAAAAPAFAEDDAAIVTEEPVAEPEADIIAEDDALVTEVEPIVEESEEPEADIIAGDDALVTEVEPIVEEPAAEEEAEVLTEEAVTEPEVVPETPAEEPALETTVEPVNPAPANASSVHYGDIKYFMEYDKDLARGNSWTYTLNNNKSCKVYFCAGSDEYEYATVGCRISVTNNDSGEVVFDESYEVNANNYYEPTVTLEAGSYTVKFTNIDYSTYRYYFDAYYKTIYTVDDPLYSISKDTVKMCPGKTFKLKVKALPEDAIIDSIIWTSSNPSVATVNENGLITAVTVGTTTVKADINGTVLSCKVTVKDPTYKINSKTASFYPKQTKQLKVTVDPAAYGLDGLTWKSSNPKVAKVNAKGLVTGVKAGTATINAKINGTVVASCKVTIKKPTYKINAKKVSLYVKKTKQLKVTVSPKVSGTAGLTWKSSNPKVAKVNSKGLVTARKAGKATITAKVNGKTLKCVVTVKPMKMNKSSTTVYVKKTKKLKVIGGDGKITWKSRNKKVATVNSNGVVKGIKPGTATIVAKRNGKTVKCKVTVKWQPETGKVNTYKYNYSSSKWGTVKTLKLSGKTKIVVTAKNKSSSEWDSVYLTLDKTDDDTYGAYTLASKFIYGGETRSITYTVGPGTYEVYVDSDDACSITIKTTTKPQITKSSTKIAKGYKEKLKVAGVKNGGKWSSSNKSIATVNSKGVVKAKKKGTCYIKYTLKTGKVLKCKVKVVSPVTCKVVAVYDTSIYNECDVKFTNYTNKKITYIKFNIKQYDNKGSRLYDSPYDWYYVNDDIEAKSSETWCDFWISDDAKKCKAYITKVYFSDGSTWTP